MQGFLHSSYLLFGTSISGDKMSKKNKNRDQQTQGVEEVDVGSEYVEPEPVKVIVDTLLEEEKVIAVENREHVYEPGYYGKDLGERLELAMVEALLLLKRGRIRVFSQGRQMSFKELYDHAC